MKNNNRDFILIACVALVAVVAIATIFKQPESRQYAPLTTEENLNEDTLLAEDASINAGGASALCKSYSSIAIDWYNKAMAETNNAKKAQYMTSARTYEKKASVACGGFSLPDTNPPSCAKWTCSVASTNAGTLAKKYDADGNNLIDTSESLAAIKAWGSGTINLNQVCGIVNLWSGNCKITTQPTCATWDCSTAAKNAGTLGVKYDANRNNIIDLTESLTAIKDWGAGAMTNTQVCGIVNLWSGNCQIAFPQPTCADLGCFTAGAIVGNLTLMYDTNQNNLVDTSESLIAIRDWGTGAINQNRVCGIVNLWSKSCNLKDVNDCNYYSNLALKWYNIYIKARDPQYWTNAQTNEAVANKLCKFLLPPLPPQ